MEVKWKSSFATKVTGGCVGPQAREIVGKEEEDDDDASPIKHHPSVT